MQFLNLVELRKHPFLAYRMRFGHLCEEKMLDPKGSDAETVMNMIESANNLLGVSFWRHSVFCTSIIGYDSYPGIYRGYSYRMNFDPVKYVKETLSRVGYAGWTLIHLRGITYFRAVFFITFPKWSLIHSNCLKNELCSLFVPMIASISKMHQVTSRTIWLVDQTPKLCDVAQVDKSSFHMHIQHGSRHVSRDKVSFMYFTHTLRIPCTYLVCHAPDPGTIIWAS